MTTSYKHDNVFEPEHVVKLFGGVELSKRFNPNSVADQLNTAYRTYLGVSHLDSDSVAGKKGEEKEQLGRLRNMANPGSRGPKVKADSFDQVFRSKHRTAFMLIEQGKNVEALELIDAKLTAVSGTSEVKESFGHAEKIWLNTLIDIWESTTEKRATRSNDLDKIADLIRKYTDKESYAQTPCTRFVEQCYRETGLIEQMIVDRGSKYADLPHFGHKVITVIQRATKAITTRSNKGE